MTTKIFQKFFYKKNLYCIHHHCTVAMSAIFAAIEERLLVVYKTVRLSHSDIKWWLPVSIS